MTPFNMLLNGKVSTDTEIAAKDTMTYHEIQHHHNSEFTTPNIISWHIYLKIVPAICICAYCWNNCEIINLKNMHGTSNIMKFIFWLFQLKRMLLSDYIILHLKKHSLYYEQYASNTFCKPEFIFHQRKIKHDRQYNFPTGSPIKRFVTNVSGNEVWLFCFADICNPGRVTYHSFVIRISTEWNNKPIWKQETKLP